jgi:hypothetical protein
MINFESLSVFSAAGNQEEKVERISASLHSTLSKVAEDNKMVIAWVPSETMIRTEHIVKLTKNGFTPL